VYITIVCKYFIFVVSMEIRKKYKAMLPYIIWSETDIKSLLGNAANNEVNNCKPDHIIQNCYIDWFKIIVDKNGNYVRKFMWQLWLCGWGIVDICMTFHRRAFDVFIPLHIDLTVFKIAWLWTVKEMSKLSYLQSCHINFRT
jgi:hypothetical protein